MIGHKDERRRLFQSYPFLKKKKATSVISETQTFQSGSHIQIEYILSPEYKTGQYKSPTNQNQNIKTIIPTKICLTPPKKSSVSRRLTGTNKLCQDTNKRRPNDTSVPFTLIANNNNNNNNKPTQITARVLSSFLKCC